MLDRDDTITTARLLLSPLGSGDVTALHELLGDPEGTRHWHELPHADVNSTREWLARTTAAPGSRVWGVRLAKEQPVIGFCGFLWQQPPPGFSYFLRRDLWRQGYMTEACRAALEHGFRELGFEQAEAWIARDNVASQALAHRLGFRRVAEFQTRWPHRRLPETTLVFGLWAHEFLSSAAPPASRLSCQMLMPLLPVRDVDEAVQFYCEHLGFRLGSTHGDPATYASVLCGDWTMTGVQLRLAKVDAAQTITPCGEILISLRQGIEAHHERCEERGVVSVGLTRRPWGGIDFVVTDPNGHRIRFMQVE